MFPNSVTELTTARGSSGSGQSSGRRSGGHSTGQPECNSRPSRGDFGAHPGDRSAAKCNSKSGGSSQPAKSVTKVYTDGPVRYQGLPNAKAGWGTYYGPHDSRNASGKVGGDQTIHRAELKAISHALHQAHNEAKSGKVSNLHIYTDSQSSKNALMKSVSTSGQRVPGNDLVQQCRGLVSSLSSYGVSVNIQYIPGHSGIQGNGIADALARKGASS